VASEDDEWRQQVQAAVERARRDLECAGASLEIVASLEARSRSVPRAAASLEIIASLGTSRRELRDGGTATDTLVVERTDTLSLTDSVVASLEAGSSTDWPNTLLIALLLVYLVCGTEATWVWPWLEEPLESWEQRVALLLAIYALIETRRRG
jgi:hypothetical protein